MRAIFLLIVVYVSVTVSQDFLPEPRIIGGQAATATQFPFMVSVQLDESHLCGGALIRLNFVLTAAHCVNNLQSAASLARLRVLAGQVDLTATTPPPVVQPVMAITVHPNYRGVRNDVAVLRLTAALTPSTSIALIALATEDPPRASQVQVPGWGSTQSNIDTIQSDVLRYINLRMITRLRCRLHIPFLDRSTLCLWHSSGSGVCGGDSGGPAVYERQLVGITSFTVGNCGRRRPDGFARISVLRSWILENAPA